MSDNNQTADLAYRFLMTGEEAYVFNHNRPLNEHAFFTANVESLQSNVCELSNGCVVPYYCIFRDKVSVLKYIRTTLVHLSIDVEGALAVAERQKREDSEEK